MKYKFYKNASKFSLVIIALVAINSCNNKNSKNSRLKNGPTTSLSIVTQTSEAEPTKLAFIHYGLDAIEAYALQSISLTISEVKDAPIEIKNGAESLGLGRLSYDIEVLASYSSESTEVSLKCADSKLEIGASKDLPCAPSNNEQPAPLPEKLPSTVLEADKPTWLALADVCKSGSENQVVRDASGIVLGCYCSVPDIQVSFGPAVNPDEPAPLETIKSNFTTLCSSKPIAGLAVKPLLPQFEKICLTAKDGVSNSTSCKCMNKDLISNIIFYRAHQGQENPLASFSTVVEAMCFVP